MGDSPVFIASPNVGVENVENGDGTNWVKIFEAGTNGSRVESINCASEDTSEVKLWLGLKRSTVYYSLGFVLIPAADGDSPVQSVSMLKDLEFAESLDNGLVLLTGDELYVAANSAVTSGKIVDVVAFGGDF